MTYIETSQQIIAGAQSLLDNGLEAQAKILLAKKNIKYAIRDGRIYEEDDQTPVWLAEFVTANDSMIKLKQDVFKLAAVNDEVLIQGETGTGKELLAHALHGRRAGKFYALNCAGLPEQLVESELFGHVRGSFTGANADKIGLTVAAKNGTLFLDEIGELPLLAQSKLLRVIQDRKVRPVGSNEDKDISCRFVFATNQNIKQMCKEGTFRTDLYARIGIFELHTLSLKDRPEDIKPILKKFNCDEKLIKHVEGLFTNGNIDLSFNVRSLQHLVKRYQVLGRMP